ncbi:MULTISPECIES: anti-sigma-D factor RsdA [Nocardia]|uniref:anti-sigma-D factor RsdA n=1 Tax=Nocardia TaxID=1817 RepID=UPI00255C996D|nr:MULTISPECIES: anti-sigma-D factor RsdA [Nocardia]
MARDGERGRGDWKARLGSQDSDPYAEASGDTGPVDIAAVRRDDALIEAIAGDGPVATDSAEEYQLASLLANWRAEIVEAPMPAGPDLDTIVAAVNQEAGYRQARNNPSRRRHLRLARPILGAAAAVAVIFGGVTAFSYGAQPGDPLWPFKEVVFSQQAQTTIVQRADSALDEAQTALRQKDPQKAKEALVSAQDNATQVSDPARKSDLEKKLRELFAQLPPELQKQLEQTIPKGTSDPLTPPSKVTPTKEQPAGKTDTKPIPDPRIMGTSPDDPTNGTEPTGNVPTTPVQPPTTAVPPTTIPPTGQPPTNDPTVPTSIASPGTGGAVPTGPVTPPIQATVQPPGPVVPTSIILPGGILPGGVN